MDRTLSGAVDARQHLAGPRAFASATAALACGAVAQSSAVLLNTLLTDGAAMAAACAVARLAVWMARGLRRAIRAVAAA